MCSMFQPVVAPVGVCAQIDHTDNDPERKTVEIIAVCKRERKLKQQLQQKASQEGL